MELYMSIDRISEFRQFNKSSNQTEVKLKNGTLVKPWLLKKSTIKTDFSFIQGNLAAHSHECE